MCFGYQRIKIQWEKIGLIFTFAYGQGRGGWLPPLPCGQSERKISVFTPPLIRCGWTWMFKVKNEACLRFWSWTLVKTLRLRFGRQFDAEFCVWNLVEMLRLKFGLDSDAEFWSTNCYDLKHLLRLNHSIIGFVVPLAMFQWLSGCISIDYLFLPTLLLTNLVNKLLSIRILLCIKDQPMWPTVGQQKRQKDWRILPQPINIDQILVEVIIAL